MKRFVLPKSISKVAVISVLLMLVLSVFSANLSAAPADIIAQLKTNEFRNYDYNGDGIAEIQGFDFFSDYSRLNPSSWPLANYSALVLVLVEPRVCGMFSDDPASYWNLEGCFYTLAADLYNEGYTPVFLKMKVYSGPNHQDGLTVLAMREYLKSVRSYFYNLQGVILIGSFPEARIIRSTYSLLTNDSPMRTVGRYQVPVGAQVFMVGDQVLANSGDIVLGDLDGYWPYCYQAVDSTPNLGHYECIVDSINSSPYGCSFTSTRFAYTPETFVDFFHLNDTYYSVNYLGQNPDYLSMSVAWAQNYSMETSYEDDYCNNPVARPEICVSRINAYNIALNPDSNFRDIYNRPFLDANGKPQTVYSGYPINLTQESFWKQDPKLERRILIDYLDRNHRFRTGQYGAVPFATGSIVSTTNFGLSSISSSLEKAYYRIYNTASPIDKEGASLVDFVNWLKQPVTLRGVLAHSNCEVSNFNTPVNTYGYNPQTGRYEYFFSPQVAADQLKEAVGTGVTAWRWRQISYSYPYTYEPSYFTSEQPYLGQDYTIFNIYRTIWESGILRYNIPSLYSHAGCNAGSSLNCEIMPYNNAQYGLMQNAQGLMFYCNGLAIAAATREIGDNLATMGEAYSWGPYAVFGDAWKLYFNNDSQNSDLYWNQSPERKRTYSWVMYGDWTLRRQY